MDTYELIYKIKEKLGTDIANIVLEAVKDYAKKVGVK